MHTTASTTLQDQRLAGPDEWRFIASAAADGTSIIVEPCLADPASAPAAACKRKAARGFTLVELMIAVSVAGVLSSVALPSFENQLQRARRADALVSMMQIQAAQERFRSNGTRYGTLADIGVPAVSAAGHYALQASTATADGYDLLATAIGTQSRDTACRYLKLSASGANLVYASGPDAAAANPSDANRKCWNL